MLLCRQATADLNLLLCSLQPLAVGAACTLVVFLLNGNIIGVSSQAICRLLAISVPFLTECLWLQLGLLAFLMSLPIMLAVSTFKTSSFLYARVRESSWAHSVYVRKEMGAEGEVTFVYEYTLDGYVPEYARTQWADSTPRVGKAGLVLYNPSHSEDQRALHANVVTCCSLGDDGETLQLDGGCFHWVARIVEGAL